MIWSVVVTVAVATGSLAVAEDSTMSDTERTSYAIGYSLGSGLPVEFLDLSNDALVKGLLDAITKADPALDEETVMSLASQAQRDVAARMNAKRQEEADAFFKANAEKEGVVTLDNGLQYRVIAEGDGATPGSADKVQVNYRGTLLDGQEFDSSERHGGPAEFPVTGVIPGWTQALQLMKEGDKWELFIPSDLAYGARAVGRSIPPNSALIFEIELLKVIKKDEPTAADAATPESAD